jgi:acyl-CoA hydrolase
MSGSTPLRLGNPERMVDAIIERVGRRIVVGAPLGLGKPVHLLNALYHRAAADRTLELRIVTGLSLARPQARSDVERRMLGPIVERLFGNCPELAYVGPYSRNALPPNIRVTEFYMRAGAFLNNATAQQHHISSNYTHVARDLLLQGVNVFVQAVAKRCRDGQTTYSLSSNSDSLDLFRLLDASDPERRVVRVAQVNDRLPFMGRDALVPASTFDLVLDDRSLDHDLLSLPAGPVHTADYLIGLAASSLIRDGGTVQIGIGSLGDAIAHALCLRHRENATYQEALRATGLAGRCGDSIAAIGGTAPFETGLYGATEMFADCFRHLYRAGILSREVYDDLAIQRLVNAGRIGAEVTLGTLDALVEARAVPSPLDAAAVDHLVRRGVLREGVGFADGALATPGGRRLSPNLADPETRASIEAECLGDRLAGGSILHAGFFIGPRAMYDLLRELDEGERAKFNMTGIGFVNQLYGHEALAAAQRRHARFVNSAMMMTLCGAACSDGLANEQIVSGVGGQYNFVAMAHALEGARSILMLRSTRTKAGKVSSNIVWSYGHTTIPRHLRDIVITEYGIADLRGRQDHECIAALLNIADSRFQEDLRAEAVASGKLASTHRIPDRHLDNTPERLEAELKPLRAAGHFPTFPFGSELTHEEQVLGHVLKGLKARMGRRLGLAGIVKETVGAGLDVPDEALPYLARLGLDRPSSLRETMLQRILVAELRSGGFIRA